MVFIVLLSTIIMGKVNLDNGINYDLNTMPDSRRNDLKRKSKKYFDFIKLLFLQFLAKIY
ncbi:hypothetical protein BpHYR1_053368 [Brachionus plicatilis]|uniref:Uncharacterized protein n=1 Tax=Brachionus plicatilis TaxID=10195 RepID=A0A3M7S7A8_BRAPC|nr:hypothetical protein BpHYR1_053368 [Brachionus plicatilis]